LKSLTPQKNSKLSKYSDSDQTPLLNEPGEISQRFSIKRRNGLNYLNYSAEDRDFFKMVLSEIFTNT
jgi:hypothetical protein